MPDDTQTPDLSGLATPNELLMRRALARTLLTNSMDAEPVSGQGAISPFAIFRGVAQGLAGNNMLQNAAQAERQRQSSIGGAAQGGGPAGIGPLGAQPPSGAQPTGQTDPMAPLLNAVSHQEGSGSYSQLGPVIAKGPMAGDRAYGKYQVMGSNIGPWSQEILGQQLTPQQFLQNPNAQEAIARGKLGQYAQKYGPEGAAKAWFAGPGGMNNPSAHDQLGTTVGQYGANVAAMMPGGAAPQGGVQNASAAGPLAFKPPSPGGVPVPNAGMPAAGAPSPGLFTMRPRMNDAQYRLLMGAPDVSEAVKAEVTQRYLGQNQPVPLPAYGGNYVLNPSSGQEGFISGAPTMGTKTLSAGGASISQPYPMYGGPPGGMAPPTIYSPHIQPGPQSSAAPAGAGGPQGVPSVQPTEAGGPVPGKSSMVQPSTRLAMAEPPGTMSDAAPIGVSAGGPLSAQPPGVAQPAGLQVAQAGGSPLPGISPEDAAQLTGMRNFGLNTKFQEAGIPVYNKEYADFMGKSAAAQQALPQIQIAQGLLGKIVQGPGSDFKLAWNKALSFLGDKDAEQQMSYNQVFDKLISGGILRDMKTMLGGWAGQVRNAEIGLMNKASAGHYNTLEANKAVLDIAARSQSQLAGLGGVVRQYRDDTVAQGGIPSPEGQDKVIRAYLNSNPLYTPEEIQNFYQIFANDAKAAKAGTATGGPLTAQPPGTQGPQGAVGPLKKVQ